MPGPEKSVIFHEWLAPQKESDQATVESCVPLRRYWKLSVIVAPLVSVRFPPLTRVCE